MEQTFTEPSEEDYTHLARMWISAKNLIEEEYSYTITQSEDDLQYLQKIIDDDLLGNQNEYGYHCLGTAFGRILAKNIEGLDWWAVEDDYGRDIVIRYRETSLIFNVIPLIWRRVIEEPVIDVLGLFQWVINKYQELKD